MFIIVGLGNPGKNYVGTRHNMGFEIIDTIASKYDIKINKEKFSAQFGEGRIGTEKVILVKPQTFMNLSGEATRDFLNWYKIEPENLIVVYDDVSMPVGKLRIRPKGTAGGHNGIKNIIYQIGTDVFPRIKVGIGMPDNKEYDLADYVLGKFTKDDIEKLIPIAKKAADAVQTIIECGAEKAMSMYNG